MNNICLTLSRLPIPCSIITLIKDYAYYDIETIAKMRWKFVITNIHSCYKGLNETLWQTNNLGDFIFWIESDPKCNQYQCMFCTKCGNYEDSAIFEKIINICSCNCDY